MLEQDFIPNTYKNTLESGAVSYQSPSNIALVKYWGKYGDQLPKNSSVSFTLDNCKTTTTLSYQKKATSGFDFEVYLDGQREESFEPKIKTFFERIERYLPFLDNYTFKIETHNSFPHSSGIASSASGMSALAMCLMHMEEQLAGSMDENQMLTKASFLARLGSGSASRSIQGPVVVWGSHLEIPGSSNLFGIEYPLKVHENFKNYRDTILLVDKGEKQVSSTVGHDLMHSNPYAEERFKEADANLEKLISVFESGNLSEFIAIVESEALQLHAMMMVSKPYFILMKPNTLEIINRIWKFRQDTGSNVCFTLDAGANVHVLYSDSEKKQTVAFIESELTPFCKNGEFIHDQVGLGAKLIR
ncbi:MAG: diphosphomevalonate decarboxylase, partial [Candidatus Latescibacterota bacterium]|jgi:diphosphomevalonate decarboxylase